MTYLFMSYVLYQYIYHNGETVTNRLVYVCVFRSLRKPQQFDMR